MKRGRKCIWLLVSNDEYELPEMVCDTSQELAEKVGVSPITVRSLSTRHKKTGMFSRYVSVLEENE